MKFARITATEGIGGYYWRDQEAIAGGAKPNGFLYDGAPCTQGLDSIVQVSSTVLLSAFISEALIQAVRSLDDASNLGQVIALAEWVE